MATLTPLFLKALTTAHTLSALSAPFFSISFSTSMWTPPPTLTPTPGSSVFSRNASTSPTDAAAAFALQPLPHSNASLIACSTVDAVATTLPSFPSNTFAVICFADKNTLKTYLLFITTNKWFLIPNPYSYSCELNPWVQLQFNASLAIQFIRMASSSTTITVSRSLIRARPRYLAYRRHQNKNNKNKWTNNNASVSVFSRLSHFHNPHASSPHLPLSLRAPLLLSPPPLPLLLRPCPPHLRRPLSAMTTPQDSASTKTERVVIKGRVQGVFYRNWTVDNAKQLGLKGWVRNRKDGSVEALFSGSTDAVHEMKNRCRRGPPDAVVTALEVFPGNDDPGTGFERKPTV